MTTLWCLLYCVSFVFAGHLQDEYFQPLHVGKLVHAEEHLSAWPFCTNPLENDYLASLYFYDKRTTTAFQVRPNVFLVATKFFAPLSKSFYTVRKRNITVDIAGYAIGDHTVLGANLTFIYTTDTVDCTTRDLVDENTTTQAFILVPTTDPQPAVYYAVNVEIGNLTINLALTENLTVDFTVLYNREGILCFLGSGFAMKMCYRSRFYTDYFYQRLRAAKKQLIDYDDGYRSESFFMYAIPKPITGNYAGYRQINHPSPRPIHNCQGLITVNYTTINECHRQALFNGSACFVFDVVTKVCRFGKNISDPNLTKKTANAYVSGADYRLTPVTRVTIGQLRMVENKHPCTDMDSCWSKVALEGGLVYTTGCGHGYCEGKTWYTSEPLGVMTNQEDMYSFYMTNNNMFSMSLITNDPKVFAYATFTINLTTTDLWYYYVGNQCPMKTYVKNRAGVPARMLMSWNVTEDVTVCVPNEGEEFCWADEVLYTKMYIASDPEAGKMRITAKVPHCLDKAVLGYPSLFGYNVRCLHYDWNRMVDTDLLYDMNTAQTVDMLGRLENYTFVLPPGLLLDHGNIVLVENCQISCEYGRVVLGMFQGRLVCHALIDRCSMGCFQPIYTFCIGQRCYQQYFCEQESFSLFHKQLTMAADGQLYHTYIIEPCIEQQYCERLPLQNHTIYYTPYTEHFEMLFYINYECYQYMDNIIWSYLCTNPYYVYYTFAIIFYGILQSFMLCGISIYYRRRTDQLAVGMSLEIGLQGIARKLDRGAHLSADELTPAYDSLLDKKMELDARAEYLKNEAYRYLLIKKR